MAAVLIGLYALDACAANQNRLPRSKLAAGRAPSPVNQYSVVVAKQSRCWPVKPIPADAVRVEKLPLQTRQQFRATAPRWWGRCAVTDVGVGVAAAANAYCLVAWRRQVAEGERAVAINIDEAIAVGYRIKPGDFVDVFFFLKQDKQW